MFAIGLGIFLIILNSVISKKEEDDLEAYVQSQLTRSRSGNKMRRWNLILHDKFLRMGVVILGV